MSDIASGGMGVTRARVAHASASVVIAELLWCCRQHNISLPDKQKRIAKSAKHEGRAEKSSKSRNKFLATLSAYPVVGDQIWHMAVNALLIPCSPILLPLSLAHSRGHEIIVH